MVLSTQRRRCDINPKVSGLQIEQHPSHTSPFWYSTAKIKDISLLSPWKQTPDDVEMSQQQDIEEEVEGSSKTYRLNVIYVSFYKICRLRIMSDTLQWEAFLDSTEHMYCAAAHMKRPQTLQVGMSEASSSQFFWLQSVAWWLSCCQVLIFE